MENFIKEVEVDGISHSITLGDNMVGSGLKKGENGVVSLDINEEKLVKITYSELKSLRDNSQLTPGSFYRITDYVTTTTQEETKSANHPFDVIVLALSKNTLSEEAKAILHEGTTYFADSDLSAWELKYCLDNDKTRFVWADETNGKGVIYRMVDEKRNDCPYDFKNILFYNTVLTGDTTGDKYYYTFTYVLGGIPVDGTTWKQEKNYYGNIMGADRSSGVLKLNNNVFRNSSSGCNCHSNTFGDNCHSNTFGDNCHSNTFGDKCYSNTFEGNCYSNTFGYRCCNNSFGDGCYSNTFGVSCYSNNFGVSCYSNNFGGDCRNNSFGDFCNKNIFGYSCQSNTFGVSCYSNTFGDNCQFNTFEDYLHERNLDSDKTSITLNEEFYDDGSGQVVPIKYPDLSTQPSILPYKFMGLYVYELLIPLTIDYFRSSRDLHISNLETLMPDSLILEAVEFVKGLVSTSPSVTKLVTYARNVQVVYYESSPDILIVTTSPIFTNMEYVLYAYLKIKYVKNVSECNNYDTYS